MRKVTRSIVLLLAPWSVACSAGSLDDPRQDEPAPGAGTGALLRCEVSTLPGAATVRLSLKNPGKESVELLPWGSPWDAKADAFRVESLEAEGERAAYKGLVALRDRRTQPEYLRVEPGSAVTIDYDLAAKYALKAGDYVVSLKPGALRLRVAGKDVEDVPACDSIIVAGADHGEKVGSVQQPLVPHPDCSTAQKSEMNLINSATRTGAYYSRNLTYNGSPLYTKWFGDWGGGNADNVRTFVSRYVGQEWTLRCNGGDCCDEPGVIGCMAPEVFGDDRLYVCPPWWNMTNSSAIDQSQVHTLMHEHAHLDAAGLDGKEDIVDQGSCDGACYGYDRALNLAFDPTCTGGASTCKAIRNAENFAFFVADGLLRFAAYSSAL